MIRFKCFLPVHTGRAAAAGTVCPFITAPGQFIRDLQPQSLPDNLRFIAFDKWRPDRKLSAAALIYRLMHTVQKCLAAVRISAPHRVILVCSVINTAASHRQCHTGSRSQKQTVSEWYISLHRLSILFFHLVCIRFLWNLFLRM